MKNPLPKNINLKMGFDVSTSSTGYTILINDKPFIYKDGTPSTGQVVMQENNQGTYGDKLCIHSASARQTLKIAVYEALKGINAILLEMKKAKQKNIPIIRSFNVAFEVSEIPQKANKKYQSITSVRKLALFTGAVATDISSMIELTAFSFNKQPTYKFIKPQEWQARLWSKSESTKLNIYSESGKSITTRGSKIMSIRKANIKLKEWGLAEITDYKMNDMADSINIAVLADLVRDNVFASREAQGKQKAITKTIPARLNRTRDLMAIYVKKAKNSMLAFNDRINWFNNAKYEKLSPKDKALFTRIKTKNAEYQAMMSKNEAEGAIKFFLTDSEWNKYSSYKDLIASLEKQKRELKGNKVYG